MSGFGTPTGASIPTSAQQQAMFGATPGSATTQGFQFTPPTATAPGHRGVAEALEEAVKNGSTELLAGLKKQLAIFDAQSHDEAAAKAVLEDLMADQVALEVFALMGEGTKVRWMWGIGKIYDPMDKMDVTNGYTAFVGDRSKSGSPPPMVKLPPQNMWKWAKITAQYDDDAFVAFYDKAENSNSFFTAAAGASQETVWLPYLLYLPGELGVFVSQKSRTRAELLKEAKRLAADPNSAVTEKDMEVVRKWCIGAAVKATNTNQSSLYVGGTTVVSSEAEEFHTFLQKKCDAILGSVGPQVGPVELEQARMQAWASTMMSSMMTLQQQQHSGGQTLSNGGMDAAGLSKGREFESSEKVLIAAWSGQPNYAEASSLWGELQTKSGLVARRAELQKRIAKIGSKLGYPVNQTLFLPEYFFKEVMQLKNCYDEAVATYLNLDHGFSAQVFIEATLEFIAEQSAIERAQSESTAQRTFSESLSLSKRKPRNPPVNDFDLFARALATYAAALEAFWTSKCPLLTDVLALRAAMDLPQVTQMKAKYTPYVLATHWFNVLTQSRAFFAVHASSEDLTAARYPRSLLAQAVPVFISGMPVENAMFPKEWQHYSVPIVTHGGPPPPGPSPQFPGPPLDWGSPKDDSTAGKGSIPLEQRLAHCHPTIRKEFKEIHDIWDGKGMLSKVINAANLGMTDLPFLFQYGRGEQNTLCYSYIIGWCPNNQCKRVHVPGHALPAPFVEELCAKTKAGREYVAKQEKAAKGRGVGRKRSRDQRGG